jgi:hypothetical protein
MNIFIDPFGHCIVSQSRTVPLCINDQAGIKKKYKKEN